MKNMGKGKVSGMGRFVFGFLLVVVIAYLVMQAIRCQRALSESKVRLEDYQAETIDLSYGKMTYIDSRSRDVPTILSVHGIFGGYDQAYDMAAQFIGDARIIAPSRFGYLGSDVKGAGTPREQAQAFVELLDSFKVDQVYLLAASAGGTVAIRFALDYPERVKGVIMYSAAMPFTSKPMKYMKYAGPPAFVCNDYGMFLLSPLIKPMMGMDASTMKTLFPVSERKQGIVLDASVINTDMAKNFDDYPVEEIQVPVLILQAKDDKLSDYQMALAGSSRFAKGKLVLFEEGGHLLEGHEEEVYHEVLALLNQ